jgi:hypothetical protein
MRAAPALLFLWIACPVAMAQHEHHHPPPPNAPADSSHHQARPAAAKPAKPSASPQGHASGAHGMHGMETMHDVPGMHDMHGMQEMHAMHAMYGEYPMTREASGTSWQPDRTPHEGLHQERGAWTAMHHGFITLVANDQGGPRGGDEVMSTNMLMAMASRPLGAGRFGLRAMLSAEPWTLGQDGYALLLQTGETADGIEELVDRQHPHDLFMELAATYAVADAVRSGFAYLGLPGEPALGPPAFMHRWSGVEFPDSPITHHWLDSTHISYGVFTAGLVARDLKLEGSVFTGREPDEKRYDIEEPTFDSHSVRVSWNPAPAWALQASQGWLESPEQLHPEIDVDRTTASAMFAHRLGASPWQTLLAWGRNHNRPGNTLDAWLLESRVTIGERHTGLVRGEAVEKDELFPAPDPLAGRVFDVGKVSLGYVFEAVRGEHVSVGLGAIGSLIVIPAELEPAYGERPKAALVFARAKLR